jgi:hypothetical protein
MFVLVDDVMGETVVMLQDVAEFKYLSVRLVFDDLPNDWDLYCAFVIPGNVVFVVEVPVLAAV